MSSAESHIPGRAMLHAPIEAWLGFRARVRARVRVRVRVRVRGRDRVKPAERDSG